MKKNSLSLPHFLILLCILVSAFSQMVCATPEQAARLRIDEGGRTLLDGRPWRGVGVNYFDAFGRCLENPADNSYEKGFAELAAYNIPFARFMCGAFYASEWKQYQENPEAYFTLLDKVVASAEANGIGLIPSVFWWYPGVPDTVGEPVDQLGNLDSETAKFMRRYLGDLVERYRDRPVIWAWELGNEYNLAADLPNALNCLPPAVPALGMPDKRSERDVVSTNTLLAVMKLFGETVRAADPVRPITSGHAILRPTQYHQRTDGSWTADTTAQYCRELLLLHPDPFNLVSLHIYPQAKQGYFGLDTCSYEHHLATAIAASAMAGKAVFLGEFGAGDTEAQDGAQAARKEFEALLQAVESSGIPLAALWVYDFSWQDKDYNVTPSNHRSYQLDAIKALNARFLEKKKTTEAMALP